MTFEDFCFVVFTKTLAQLSFFHGRISGARMLLLISPSVISILYKSEQSTRQTKHGEGSTSTIDLECFICTLDISFNNGSELVKV